MRHRDEAVVLWTESRALDGADCIALQKSGIVTWHVESEFTPNWSYLIQGNEPSVNQRPGEAADVM